LLSGFLTSKIRLRFINADPSTVLNQNSQYRDQVDFHMSYIAHIQPSNLAQNMFCRQT